MNKESASRQVTFALVSIVPAAIVSGIAAAAVGGGVPANLRGTWRQTGGKWSGATMVVSRQGNVKVIDFVAKFSHLTAHQLTISDVPVCITTKDLPTKGTYGWKVAGDRLTLTKIHDSCKDAVALFAGVWARK